MIYRLRGRGDQRTSVQHPVRRLGEPVQLLQRVTDDEVRAVELDDLEVIALHAVLGGIIELRRIEAAQPQPAPAGAPEAKT